MHYLDLKKYPYFVLGSAYAKKLKIKLGDIAPVENLDNGKSTYAISGHVGPNNFKESSIKLINDLNYISPAQIAAKGALLKQLNKLCVLNL